MARARSGLSCRATTSMTRMDATPSGSPPTVDGNNTLYLANSHEGHLNFTIGGAGALGNTFHNLARLTTLAGVIQVDAAGGDGATPSGGTINGTITNNNIWNDAGFVNGRRAIDVQVE